MRLRFRVKRIAFSVAGLVIGPWLAVGAWDSLQGELRLGSQGIRTMAAAREAEVCEGIGDTSYKLRYDFKVPGRAEEFSARALFPYERRNLFERVPESACEDACRTGRVEVVYLPDDPWINRPADPAGHRLADRATALAVGAGWAIAGVVGLAVGFWQYRRLRAAPNGRRQFWLFWVED
jgi:hypothetical protein